MCHLSGDSEDRSDVRDVVSHCIEASIELSSVVVDDVDVSSNVDVSAVVEIMPRNVAISVRPIVVDSAAVIHTYHAEVVNTRFGSCATCSSICASLSNAAGSVSNRPAERSMSNIVLSIRSADERWVHSAVQ